MASSHTSIPRLLSPLLQSFRSLSLSPLSSIKTSSKTITSTATRSFSSTPIQAKKEAGGKTDPRITLIRYHMQHGEVPRPLKLSRMRALRHWTIHRAWNLARGKKLKREEVELQRMYQSMHNAMEELRLLDPPGAKDAGRLYRVALEKKGIYRHGEGSEGVPIEYARMQTETPGKEPWNHDWKR